MSLKLSGVLNQWKNFDLPTVQRELDAEAAGMGQRQDESEAARKQLIELSREFKKSATEETKGQVAPLLKNFQSEIDKLSQRSKAAEVQFLGLYKKLTDVTDPVPLLEMTNGLQAKAARMQDVDLEVKQLRETLAEYNEEFRQVRNQEVTIKQLKEKVRQAEESLEVIVQSRLEEHEDVLRSQFEEKERELVELNRLTARRLAQAESKFAAQQATVTELQSELFDAKAGAEVISHAKLDEIEILMQDLDRANQRAVLAEKELSVLKEQFERAEDSSKRQRLSSDQANEAPPPPNMDTPLDVMGRPSLLELAAKEKEVQTLIEDVQKLQSTLNQLRESSARQLSNFEEELQVRGQHIQRLEAQLEAQKDYQEIRRELSILKSIEFPHLSSTVDDEDERCEDIAKKSDKVSTSASAGGNKPLEVLLLERNKVLQSENTALKVANSELQGEEEKAVTLRLEETSPPSPPPSSSSSASPGPAVVCTSDAIVAGTANDNNNKSLTTDCQGHHSASDNNNDKMPSSTRLGLNSPMAAAAAAAAAAASASVGAHVGPPPPFSPFVGAVSASGLMGPRHLPPVFHPVLGGLGSLGHFFNEDMLLHWRRSLEASMLSHHHQQQLQQQQQQQQQERRVTSPDRARASSPGSDNGGEENSSLFGQRTPTRTTAEGPATTPTNAPRCPSTPTGQQVNTSTPNSCGITTLPGWPSWEDSHLARLQQEFITRGGVYPGFGGPGSVNSLAGGGLGNGSLDGGDGPSAAALASLMALPEGLTSLLAKSNPLEARLQEMLRATMERYASQALDTLAISRGVRELLSMHNIGQRLFAKFVLGLSQGTVSELLSKPKPWDKLTEKGRDSYRKMHAWACDEAAILLLKSLIPRKGKETGGSSVATKTEESAVTEERIAHILHEASAALRAQQVDDSGSDESKPPSQTQTPSPGPKVEPICSSVGVHVTSTSSATTTTTTPTSSSSHHQHNNNNNSSSSNNLLLQQQQQQQQRRGRKPDHDDISQEQVLRIYHDELAKMMSGGSSAAFNPAAFNPAHLSGLSALAAGGGSRAMSSNLRDYNRSYTSALFERTPEEIRMALDVYQQELNRLMQPPTSSNVNATSTTTTSTTAAAAAAAVGHLTSTPVGSAGSQHQSTSASAHVSNGFPQDLSLPKSAAGAGSVRSDEESSERDGGKIRSAVSSVITNKSLLMTASENGERSKSVAGETGNNVPQSSSNSMALFMPHSLHNILRPSSSLSPDESNAATGAAGSGAAGVAAGNGGVASPLQRIASITNSLMSQPANPTLPQVTQRPMKAILPPITQQQFDTYQNLNTEDIVKKVKEQLSQYSISQRLFGESVLGLSQGSVSDLLARPKPWHMLTQKGREPFIRMKIFLEDENAVHKLVASQYKIAPEKLMRTGGYSGTPQSAALKNSVAKMMTPTSMPATSPAMSASGNSTGGMDLSPNSLAHSAMALHGLRGPAGALASLSHGAGMDLNSSLSGRTSPMPSGLTYGATLAHFMSAQSSLNQRNLASQMAQQQQQHHHHQQQQLHQSPVVIKSEKNSGSTGSKSLSGTQLGGHNNNANSNGLTPSPMDDSSTPSAGHGLVGSGIPTLAAYSLPAHSVYELAALTQELDTQGMTTKIKEVLLANNIGQKIFGEAVLGLSQGSVSELLSKPKPWHMLSIKGREPFIRMQLWLSDPRNIEHIQRLKTERREAGKRRRDLGFPMSATDAAGPNSNASSNTNSFMGGDNSSNDGSMGGSPSPYGGNPIHHQATSLTTGAGASLSSSSPSPAKKQRILFSDQQKEALKLAFSLDPYPSTSAMEFLAQELNLSTRTITNWFHNHRMRLKQQQSNSLDCSAKEEISSSASPANTVNGGRESSGQFDPIHFRLLFHQRLFEMQVAAGEDASGHHTATGGSGGGHHPGAGAGGMNLPGSLVGLPPQLAGNLNMMASLGMPYPFYATGMLSQFCMGLGNPSPDMAPGAEGLDLTLARQRVAALAQSDSDAEDSDCESDTSSRTGPTTHRDLERRRDGRPPVKMASPLMTASAKTTGGNHLGMSQEEPAAQAARSSRRSRKPAAPQWVNPHWQQNSAIRERNRLESEDGRDSSEERDKKKAELFSSHVRHHSVDANLNNFVETDPKTSGGGGGRSSVDDDKYDNDADDDDDEDESPGNKLNHRHNSPSGRSSPSPSSDEDKMEDESEAKDDDNNERS